MARRKTARQAREEEKAARVDISNHFRIAREAFSLGDKGHANDHVRKARRIAMKKKIRLTPLQQKRFCPNCYSYLAIGKNCRVRLRPGKMVYKCDECRHIFRIPYK